jgi:hypothetical protein
LAVAIKRILNIVIPETAVTRYTIIPICLECLTDLNINFADVHQYRILFLTTKLKTKNNIVGKENKTILALEK